MNLQQMCPKELHIPGGGIWLARRFAFSRDKGQYENRSQMNSQKLLLMYKVIGLSKDEVSRSSQTFSKPFELCNNCESVVSYNIQNGSSRHFTSPFLS